MLVVITVRTLNNKMYHTYIFYSFYIFHDKMSFKLLKVDIDIAIK